MNAVISDCGEYRYWLSRPSDLILSERNPAVFVMLNPSTADAESDDPTIRRCKAFAKSWDYTGLRVVNLYALRSTNPKNLWTHEDPVGPDNDYWLKKMGNDFTDIICAWGNNAKPDRVSKFVSIMDEVKARLWCLGTTKSGAPKHPLYVKSDQSLIQWEWLNE